MQSPPGPGTPGGVRGSAPLGCGRQPALCDLHHRAVHFEKLVVRGAAPDRLIFEFRRPRDRRNVTDDDAPLRATALRCDTVAPSVDAPPLSKRSARGASAEPPASAGDSAVCPMGEAGAA